MYSYKAIISSKSPTNTQTQFTSLLTYLTNQSLPFFTWDFERSFSNQNIETGAFSTPIFYFSFVCYAQTIQEIESLISANSSFGFVAVVFRSQNGERYNELPFTFLT